MPTTRSAGRAADAVQAHALVRFDSTLVEVEQTSATRTRTTKRKADGSTPSTPVTKKARASSVNSSPLKGILKPSPSPGPAHIAPDEQAELVPAVLTFSFEEAKRHLIDVDGRFADVFKRMKCRPFEHLEQIDPFRTLTQSILGQQISWKAARSIAYKFIRLYDDSLPEIRPQGQETGKLSFPTARQVANTDITTLRSAGLSARKAEYVQDLAARFADGRLSTEKVFKADDEELAKMLIEVRGIGRWTVDMFAMFSLRRPDILPVGDLGVQRGLVRWFLSLHCATQKFGFSPEKLPKAPADEEATAEAQEKPPNTPAKRKSPRKSKESPEYELDSGGDVPRGSSPDVSSVPPAPPPATPAPRVTDHAENGEERLRLPALPIPFTPSIEVTLAGASLADDSDTEAGAAGEMKSKGKGKSIKPAPLPAGLSVAVLKGRLEGKKIKGAFLTPKEMEDLTEHWRPYRSLGVYYMWALADAET